MRIHANTQRNIKFPAKIHTSTCGCELDRASAAVSDSKGFVDSSNGFDGVIGVIAGVTETYQYQVPLHIT